MKYVVSFRNLQVIQSNEAASQQQKDGFLDSKPNFMLHCLKHRQKSYKFSACKNIRGVANNWLKVRHTGNSTI